MFSKQYKLSIKKITFLFALIIYGSIAYCQLNPKIVTKATEAKAYCKKNKLNSDFCFLVDFSVHSGSNRFYIYDFKTNVIKSSGLVCHGVGKSSTVIKPVYSNEIGSYCTSLGKYKIGKRGYSNWGIHVLYKLHGLEKTNSNALARNVVLHSYQYVPTKEINPAHLTMGWSMGCPVVDTLLMKQIDVSLKKATKPTLLWIFETVNTN